MSSQNWKWYGFAGHHCCGARCQFHLTTAIGGRYLVSTVGRFVPDPLRAPEKIEPVGLGRYFETMVFEIDGEDENGDPNVLDWGGVDMEGYNFSLTAEQGHYAICERYSREAT